jgi:hypothetical protein
MMASYRQTKSQSRRLQRGLGPEPINMKDLRERLDKLRADAADFAVMSRQASDAEKRELFGRLADELAIEALELEQVVKLHSERSGSSDPENVVTLKSRPEQD